MSGDSDSSSTDSNSSSEVEEDIGVQTDLFEPYTNEPLASNDESEEEGETDDEDGIRSDIIAERFDRSVEVGSWCQCEHCSDSLLVSAREFRCCKEVTCCLGKFTFEGQDAKCITEHWEFEPIVHKAVLKLVGPLLTDKSGKKYRQKKNQPENEYLRAVAYRVLVKWLFGYLGWDNARPLPACVYHHIRTRYPSAASVGYKGSAQRQ